MTVSYKIRYYRDRLNLSQEELAKKSGVSRALISGLESGSITETSTASLKKLAMALEISVSDIFLESESNKID